MCILQIEYKARNIPEMKVNIDKCVKLLEEGGDWERRNKLKVYQAVYFMMVRDFKSAAKLFLDSMSTFNSPEVISFEKLVFYAVLTAMMTLGRVDIKEKVMKNSEVLSVIKENETLSNFLNSYYKCNYKIFFTVLIKIIEDIGDDAIMSVHKKFIVKELRITIYSQFLESYKSATLEYMAGQFGVSPRFLDKELSDFINQRRLNCKIDMVSGLIELERVDERNLHYKKALKEGESLLNRIQRLSRVIDV